MKNTGFFKEKESFAFLFISKKIGLSVCIAFLSVILSSGQTIGDFRSNGTGNWSSLATWQEYRLPGPAWRAATSYPGQNAGTGTVTIQNNHIITLDVSPANDVGTLDIPAGNQDSWITISGTNSLVVTGSTTITSNSNNDYKAVLVNAGSFSTGSLTMNSNGNSRDAYIEISTGTVNVSGDLIMNASNLRTYVRFTDSGSLYVGGNMSGGGITSTAGGGTNPTSGTVNYNGSGDQNIGDYTYYNLTVSNSGSKTMQGAITVNNDLAIQGSAILATQQYQITGNAAGTFTMDAGTGLTLGSAGSAINVLFPSNYTTGNITLDDNSTVTYQANGAQSVSGAPPSYGNLTIATGNTKTMQGNVTVNNNLNLDNGNLSLGAATYNLTIAGGAAITTPGSFNNTHMIVCDGTGYIIKETADGSGLAITYPVGTGTYYTPMEITSMSATGSGSLSVRTAATIAPGPPPANSTDLERYWDVSTSGITVTSADVTFTYIDPADIGPGGNEADYEPAFYTGGTWLTPGGASINTAANTFSSSGTPALTGQWTAREPIITYYSYQSGDWATANTWTTDPSGTLLVNPAVPGASDRIVILNGRTITTAVSRTVYSLQINEGGTLDIGNTTGHNFGSVSGQGLLRLQSNTFPGGTFTSFVAAGGGTVEYFNLNGTRISNVQLTYNNLIISNSTTNAYTVYLDNNTNPVNYIINSDFTLNNSSTGSLAFRFGNPVASNNKINLTIYGNFTVNAGCSILVNNFNTGQSYNNVHNLNIYGDFTNNGSVRFTGLPSPVINAYYLLATTTYGGQNYGAVKVTFAGTTNNTLVCNGTTDFYRLVIDKGTDQTYMLDVTSANVADFALYGPNNQGGNQFDGGPEGFGVGVYEKALFINGGTLKLNDNINIPSLTEGGQDFNIIPRAGLWINGATVLTTVVGVNGTGWQAATLYGRLKINAGSFSTGDAAGIVLGILGTPEIVVEGTGTLSASQVWSAVGGSGNKISYIQSGGTVNIRLQGENHAGPMLGLTNTNTVFTMSGGTLNFTDVLFIGGGTCTQIMDLRAATGNYSVTGGTVNFSLPSGYTYTANTTVPFYNLVVTRRTGGGTVTVQWLNTSNTKIDVQNDLRLNANTALDLATNTVNLNAGHDFTMDAASSYNSGNNTTTFNGAGGQRFTNAGTISGGTGLYNLTFSNTSNTDILTSNLIIRNALTINANCYLNDIGHNISVAGNILNSGTHTSQAGGGILLNGGGAQTIGGSGNGIFGNLIINKAAGTTTLISGQSLTGNLRLAGGLLDIGIHKLSLGVSSNIYDALYPQTTAVYSGTKMIRTAGNQSDGGVEKYYNLTNAFVFPVGTASDYTPATIQFTVAPATWGSVTTRPVAQYNPFVTSTNSLNYYWKVTSSEITGIPANSVSHTYRYVDSDLIGRGTESNYIPGVYNSYAWVYINDPARVVDATNDILFTNVSYINGEYTAGEPDAFQAVKVFYSRQDGDWNDVNTWSSVSVGGPADGALPGSNNPVVIGDGAAQNHTVTVPAGYNNIIVGSLQINSGSVLDITTTTGHNFGAIPDTKITGTGKLMISSSAATATFPGGDFGNFLSEGGGTVEYYNTAAQDFTLPAGLTYYNNLVLSPSNGRYIAMPNINITVFGELTIDGTGTGVARLNSSAARILTVEGDINITGSTLRFMNNNFAQTIYANSDINIATGAIFDVTTGSNATNILYIAGSLNNDGNFDMYGGAATRVCNVYFTGDADKEISGSGTNEFNYLNVDKGTSRNTILNVTADNMTLSGTGTALILNNGTFRVSNPGLNLTLSTNTAFTIPVSAALSVNEGAVTIGTNSNAGDLSLAGRLEVLNTGTVNIGNNSGTNNDIEYAPAGNPEIIIQGGTLTVDGQIRRLIDNTLGSLIYTQSGGNVLIKGLNQQNTRAKFEVLNTGSQFNMSGGSLAMVNGGGDPNYFGDIQIVPETSSVSGGDINIGTTNTTAGANTIFYLNSLSPLWNLNIDATTRDKIVNLRVNSLVLNNDLTIYGNSEFHANGLNINLGHNLINNNSNAGSGITTGGYQAGTSAQITTFDGEGAQTIAGAGANLTNFANMVITSSSSVSLAANSSLRVNGCLNINSGILNDGSNTITVTENISNTGTHNSSSASGGIILTGSQQQVISGNGACKFGNVNINNPSGVNMTDNSEIDGVLTFTQGSIYIDDYLLTFGINATISGTPGVNRMIILNGVMSDQGVKKIYPSGAGDFTFPVGVAGKYTPARLNVTANSATGTITVRPVNTKHPLLWNGGSGNHLTYYWYVTSTGFGSPTVEHTYYYSASDVTGAENTYVAGRFYGLDWTPTYVLGDNTISTVNHTISLMLSSGVNFIDGEYTAGDPPNFVTPVIYCSRNSTSGGNWTDPNAWTLNSDGSGGPAPSYPQGNLVVILSGHTITLDANSQNAYSVDINGTLEVGTTLYHNLGHIRGGGTISITSTASGSFILPAGKYDDFMNNSSSTVEFYNNSGTPAILPLKPGNDYKPFQNVIFSGNGVKNISADNMRILGNLAIAAGTGTLSNTLYNKNITILGNWTDNNTSAAGGLVPGQGAVIFNGTAQQTLTVTNGTTTGQFYDLRINNASGMTIAGGGQVSVSRYLYLTQGNITTNLTNLLSITNTSATAVIGGGSASFIDGPLRKQINSGSYFDFPVGNSNGTRYGNLHVSTVSAAGNYTARYYNHNPGDDGYDPDNKVNPIDVVSDVEYWSLNGSVASAANVMIRWDSQSGIIPPSAVGRSKLRIVEWNGSAWQNRGNIIVDGGVNSGTIQTNPEVTVNGNHYFTIGVESLPTATITSGDSSICDDGSITSITIDLTGTSPWTIKYMVNGANETTINNIATSPYTLVVSNAMEPLASGGPGDYIFNVSYIRDATGSTGIRDFTTTITITLNESPVPSISGNTTVDLGETVDYSTPLVGGHTYQWTVNNGTIIGSSTNNTVTVQWASSPGSGWVRVQETATVGGCSTTTPDYNVTITDIPDPVVTGPTPVCLNETVTYRTPVVGTHTYSWFLPLGGGTIIGSTTLDSVVVQWIGTGLYYVKVDETAPPNTESDSLEVTVNPLPDDNNTVTDPTICFGQIANIIVQAAAPGITYQLYLASDDSPVGPPVSSGPGGDVLLMDAPEVTTDYYVVGTNEYNCGVQLIDFSTVTVNPLPVPGISGADTLCEGSTETYTTDAGMSNYDWEVSAGGTVSGGGDGSDFITIRWDDIEAQTVSVNYEDGNGCAAASPTVLDVWVSKLPDTGPGYHIENEFNP